VQSKSQNVNSSIVVDAENTEVLEDVDVPDRNNIEGVPLLFVLDIVK